MAEYSLGLSTFKKGAFSVDALSHISEALSERFLPKFDSGEDKVYFTASFEVTTEPGIKNKFDQFSDLRIAIEKAIKRGEEIQEICLSFSERLFKKDSSISKNRRIDFTLKLGKYPQAYFWQTASDTDGSLKDWAIATKNESQRLVELFERESDKKKNSVIKFTGDISLPVVLPGKETKLAESSSEEKYLKKDLKPEEKELLLAEAIGRTGLSKWWSMDNPLVYILVVLVVTAVLAVLGIKS